MTKCPLSVIHIRDNSAYPPNVRSTPDSDRRADIAAGPFSAKTCREQAQQKALLFDHLVGSGEKS
jgi:hypothetical protein